MVTSKHTRVGPRGDFPAASVDPTEARNDVLVCFGRSDPKRAMWPAPARTTARAATAGRAHRHHDLASSLSPSSARRTPHAANSPGVFERASVPEGLRVPEDGGARGREGQAPGRD